MLKTLRKSLAKKMILLAFVVGLISPSAQAYFSDYTGSQNNSTQGGSFSEYTGSQNDSSNGSSQGGYFGAYTGSQLVAVNEVAPAITNLVLNPNPYNTANGNATVTFKLNTTAKTTVDIMSVDNNGNGSITKNLMFDTTVGSTAAQSGSCSWNSFQTVTCTWNGKKSNGQPAEVGTYKVKVIAYNSISTVTAEYMFNVTTSPVAVAPDVSVSVNPTTIDQAANQSSTITYSLNTQANLSVEVWQGNNYVTTLKNLASTSAGTYNNLTWNGKAGSSNLTTGVYTVKVYATNAAGEDTATATLNVVNNTQVTAPVVSNVTASPSPFDPNTQTTTISFTTDKTADVLIEIYNDATGEFIKSISAGTGTGTRTVSWNGAGTADNTQYRIKATATNAAGSSSAFGFVLVDYQGQQGNVPVITNVYATPTPFDPEEENTRIYFTLDKSATVTVKILDGSNTVATLVSNVSKGSGTHYYEWNGRTESNNSYVVDGTYVAKVFAYNTAGDATPVTTAVVVDRDGNNGGTCNFITSHYVTKSTFDPEKEDVLIYYAHNQAGYVTVRVKDGSSTVKTLVDHVYYQSGSRYISWNGRNTSGNYASDRTYTYEIKVELSGNIQDLNCYSDTETGSVRVDRDGTDDNNNESDWPSTDENLITNVSVDNEVFDPRDDERSTIRYRLNDRADVKVQVMDGNRVVRTLANVNDQNQGTYSYPWDGRDSDGRIVTDRVYQFRIMADNGDDTDTDRAYVEVDTDGIIIGFPDNARCAGFKDVSMNSPFCKAIEAMKGKNIFDGYSDGTFRPYVKINRAEATKVIVLALGYDVPTANYFGKLFKDIGDAWYTKYIWVAKTNNIVDGYPDGYFRPAKTIIRVELLKIFLEANNVDADYCQQPFIDTPNNADTAWYMKYACFAKENDLMGSENSNRLYPAEAMTRGDVAQLFYDFEVKGLYNYYGSNKTNYSYQYDNNYNDEDGYYVYQNGKYVWVSY